MMTMPSGKGSSSKLAVDTLWTAGAFGSFALAGLVMNVIVAATHGPAGLGVFTLAMTVYLLLGQVAVLGIHASVVHHRAATGELRHQGSSQVLAAVMLSGALGAVASVLVAALARPYAALVDSPGVGDGLLVIAPALLFFSLNKVLLAVLNAERRMRAFSLAQMGRAGVLVTAVAVAALIGRPAHELLAAFVIAEVLMTAGLAIAVLRHHRRWDRPAIAVWMRRHWSFGARGFMGGLMVEANSRVDILMLGFVVSDETVGLYGFASMFAVGFHSLLMVVKQNVNPILARQLALGELVGSESFIRGAQRWIYPAALGLALLTLALFPFLAGLLGGGGFSESWWLLAILLAGIVAAAGYLPFDAILLQAGRPGEHTVLTLAGLLTNVGLNAALIPVWGAYGAAAATCAATILSVAYLTLAARCRLGVRVGGPLAWKREQHARP